MDEHDEGRCGCCSPSRDSPCSDCQQLTAMALALIASAGAQARSTADVCDGARPRDCREIVQATAALTQMLVSSDPAPLSRYLDSRAIWVPTKGIVRPGTDLIAAVRRDTPRAAARLDHVRIRFFGDTAVVMWRESWTAPSGPGALAGVDTWAKRRGKWRIVATVESKPQP